MAKSKTIKLKSYIDVQEEYVLSEIVKPGYLLQLASTNLVAYHATAAGEVLIPMFAQENEFLGKTVGDAYAVGDKLQVWIPTRGDQVNAVLKAGQKVVIGDNVVSNGDGTLKKTTSTASDPLTAGMIVGVAVEAVDLTASGAVDTLVAVRIK